MKKIKTITVEYKKPVHLFRDDLLTIESILKQDLAGQDFQITFDTFDLESVSSIPTDQKLSNDLSFYISNPYFSIKVGLYSSRFYASENSLQIMGAIKKIEGIFDSALHKSEKVRRWVGRSMYWLSILSGSFLAVTFLLDDVEMLKNIFSSSKIVSLMLVVLFFLCLISWGQMTWPLKPIIEFEMRNNIKNFWEKNREQIYVGLIVGVPVAIISFTLGVLAKI